MDGFLAVLRRYSDRSSISEAGQSLLLADAYLMPELGHRGARDADGRAYHADAGDPVGVAFALWIVDLSAPECACLVTPLGEGLELGLLVVTHGSFSLEK